jgi:hypothetical protein
LAANPNRTHLPAFRFAPGDSENNTRPQPPTQIHPETPPNDGKSEAGAPLQPVRNCPTPGKDGVESGATTLRIEGRSGSIGHPVARARPLLPTRHLVLCRGRGWEDGRHGIAYHRGSGC